jgi:branched-chain amino acid transport system ATP-binding protein
VSFESGSTRVRPESGRREFTGTGGDFVARDVTVRFGGLVALDSVGLHVRPGEVHGVIGPNGAGKTTLFNVVCGFISPNEGGLSWRGEELKGLRPHHLSKLGISRTLQGVGLFQGMTVLENVMVGARRHSKAGFFWALLGLPMSDSDERRLRERSLAVLDELNAAQFAGRYPGSLPYPDQKRVALARAVVSEPDLLMLDEPASGLSNAEMDELGDHIHDFASRMSVMLVEHHMDLVMRVCDRITVLDFGRVIANGTPDEVRNDPAVIAAYLGQDSTEEHGHLGEPDDAPTPRPASQQVEVDGGRSGA